MCSSDLVREFQDRARQKSIELELLLAPDLPHAVDADPVRFAQVLRNLVDNAVKFTETGRITVDAYYRNVTPSHANETVSVIDTGIGMDEALQTEAFDLFHQGDGSNTRPYQGTGLGLSLVRQLVDKMGGTMSIKSQAGKGTNMAFSVQLPICENSVLPAEDEPIEVTLPGPVAVPPQTPKRSRILARSSMSYWSRTTWSISSLHAACWRSSAARSASRTTVSARSTRSGRSVTT